MRRYETIVIVDPDLGEERRTLIFDRIRELVPQKGGLVVEFDEWGARKMAYEIKKKKRGFYLRVDYCGTGDLVKEMERQFRIDDRVLKYMTILLEDDVDMESIQEKMSQADEAPEAAVTEPPTTASPKETTASAEDAPAATAETTESAEDTEPAATKEDE
ncbi:MAG: 30S ribosomal protein S6 [Desulfobacterales bacterium]|jgi:small subunit ribosomal protein S6